jgi:hypothetical protein
MIAMQIVVFIIGLGLVISTIYSAVETFVLPRGAPNLIVRLVTVGVRRIFELRLRFLRTYEKRDRLMALFAPAALLILLPVWLSLILIGYMSMFWALGMVSWYEAFRLSGSSLLTLGFAHIDTPIYTLLEFSEATIGLILLTLLIAYLPTMYSAFSRRETAVTLLEVRAGDPPSAVELLKRFQRIHGLEALSDQWHAWEVWFADIEESHTSLAMLVFFRSPRSSHSWIIAAGTIKMRLRLH